MLVIMKRRCNPVITFHASYILYSIFYITKQMPIQPLNSNRIMKGTGPRQGTTQAAAEMQHLTQKNGCENIKHYIKY